MIDRAEKAGFGIALTGHVALFALLSLGLVSTAKLPPLVNEPMDVILTDEVGMRSAVPNPATEAPAPSEAPELAPPDEPAPSEPEPIPAPEPVAKPKASDVPQVPKPADKPKPAEKPQPTPKKEEQDMGDRRRPDRDAKGSAQKAGGSRLGSNFLKGISDDPKGKASTPRASISGPAMQGLGAALIRQIQPCLAWGSLQGTSAMTIVTTLRMRYRPDGTLIGVPELVQQTGVDDSNRRYARQMEDAARRAVIRCAPVRLPPDLYQGGWDDIAANIRPERIG